MSNVLSRRVAWTVTIVATLTMTVSYIDRATFSVLAPTVSKALDLDEQAYGWLASAFSIAYLIATPIGGWWIDHLGARRGLVRSVLAWSIVAALHAVVPGFGVLFALRIALGFAEGPSFPGAAQTVQRVLPERDRPRGFGVLFIGSSIGGMLVPPLASWIYEQAGWRVAFLGTAVIGLSWLPLWILLTRRADVRAQLETATAADAAPKPRFFALVRDPRMVRALCGIVAAAPVLGFVQSWGSKYLVRTFQLEQGQVGHYLWLPPLMYDVFAVGFGDLASRRRRATETSPRLLYTIAMALAASMALIPYADSAWTAMVIFGFTMGGGGALYTLVTSDLLAKMPAGSVSFAGGILAGAQSLAFVIANPLIGRAVDRLHSYDDVTRVLGAWVIPGSLLWLSTGAFGGEGPAGPPRARVARERRRSP